MCSVCGVLRISLWGSDTEISRGIARLQQQKPFGILKAFVDHFYSQGEKRSTLFIKLLQGGEQISPRRPVNS